ncbi:hypothetical protein ACSV4D_07990 [Flavobacterium sp. ARAG 55.4]|uniref:hypothetical protein n=1 Tax=Flavobacterium sp. ARAG 55.4 TaxID=3451357 RepID=UPI003F45BF11
MEISAQSTEIVRGFNHIESVATDGKYLYVADIGKELAPMAKDQDGKIIVLNSSGKIIKSSFTAEKLNAPKGLAIDNGVLYTNDIDRIVAFDLKTGNKLYQIDFGNETSFLNDIAVWDKNTLYVSATDKNKLFKVNLINKTFSEVKTDKVIPGINGLFCCKRSAKLYVNGFGTDNNPNGIVGYVNLQNNNFTLLTDKKGYYDGIQIHDDILYFSDWVAFEKKGIIQTITLKTGKEAVVKMDEPINGPADFTIFKNTIVSPGMMDGTLLFIPINKTITN